MQHLKLPSSIHKELLITWHLLYTNVGESIILPIIGMLARFLPTPALLLSIPWPQLALILCKTVAIFLCYSYIFEVVNQVTSVEEDRINKPHRPIPSGLLTVRGGHQRWALSWLICPLLVYYLAGPGASALLLWYQLWTYFCYVWPRLNHFVLRSAFVAVGVYNMFRLIDETIRSVIASFPLPPVRFYLCLSAWVMATIHLQEFHDSEGDRVMGRRTLPVVVGPEWEGALRWATALVLGAAGMSPLMNSCMASWHCGGAVSGSVGWIRTGAVVTAALHAIFAVFTGVRCVRGGKATTAYDRRTYKRFYMMAAYTMICYLSFMTAVWD
ncbi:UbiA family prenyltransferase [Aspergillus clavatus NRRL 1]|uniref:UbiA prenyltransferase family protein n=1 Tax=Aspergillus clavatus (strain ATCC 1007 / CBS 513.65 / DSM 816 / NCTC 3887 / NRRL 1 / QM 1276 / 107) TaxID=344612 RepID=A1CFD9_ASPCL|nr:UbiA prenyltransferase family protein [Aspergillus clavatus NRRL 1]EAW11588.1 UbiA prenyltransferase family protein [Aspergillus clavatus NRRL 1]